MEGWSALDGRGLIRRGQRLAPFTTYKLGGPAMLFVEVNERSDLEDVVAGLRETPLPVLVLGRGSNVVVSDDGFAGVVVYLGSGFTWIRYEDDELRAGGSTPLPQLARSAVRLGRGGLEFYVGIPGSVGGAVRMNAGCLGADTASVLIEARVFSLADGATVTGTPATLDLAYRHSNLGDLDVVLEAGFRTEPTERAKAEQTMRDVSRWRREHQPGGTLNAGSVFKNPPGDAAGRIIEDAGLKGFRVGSVAVSEKHANFIVADREASARDVYELVVAVRETVRERTGIDLSPEIRFVGEFEGNHPR